MKNKFIITMLLISISFYTMEPVKADTKDDREGDYFKERITNSHKESVLIPFNEVAKLNVSQAKAVKEEVWKLWKDVNLQMEALPPLSASSEAEMPLHQWELIDEDPMPFYFFKKEDSSSKEKKPLFINLHGSGPKEIEFRNTLLLSKKYADSPSVYFIPQIPNVKRYRWWFQPVQDAWEKLFRLAMLHDEIDPNKIFIMGISEGAYGSQRLGAYYADYLAGVGPMAGGEPLKNAPPLNYRNTAFSFHTGENDTFFGRNAMTALAATTFDSLATKYPGEFIHNIVIQKGRGHAVDYTLTTPWLKTHTRKTSPDHISWVYFPMHGRYRKGFYNVAITESTELKEEDEFNRIFFDIQYKKLDNTIEINSSLMNDEMTATKEVIAGQISLFLDERYVNFDKKVKVIYNGKLVHNSKLTLNRRYLVESCALFGDPNRLFPAKISISL